MSDIDAEVTANLERHFLRQIDRVADRLRSTADQIERRKKIQAELRDGRPDYSGALSDVMHDLQTMWGNLPIDTITRAATDAHVYVRVGTLDYP